MSHAFEKTVDNATVVQLERANEIRELLTEHKTSQVSPDVEHVVQRATLTEIIS